MQSLGTPFYDSDFWHYLDIHGAVFYLINKEQKVFAVVLAQHNHFRSYVVGTDVTREQASEICFAEKSNEPYLCSDGGESLIRPTAPNFRYMEWILNGKNRPLLGAWDRLPQPKERESVTFHLEFLQSRDPLITSWSSLGPQLKLLGFIPSFYRDAPPGMAIFNTPQLKKVGDTAQAFYFDPKNREILQEHYKNTSDFFNLKLEPALSHNSRRFMEALKNAGWFQKK